jgi:hypothetical protein
MKILLVNPPLMQLNTPYPATTQLVGFLKTQQVEAVQMDLSIELISTLFTREGMTRIFEAVKQKKEMPENVREMLEEEEYWLQTIEPVMRFLSGRDQSLANRFADLAFWPESKRFPDEEELEWAFGTLGTIDRAKHLCTLFLKDLCDLIQTQVDERFELIRYGEKLCMRLPEFAPLQEALQQTPSLVELYMLDLLRERLKKEQPDFVGFSIPFPGNLFSALRCAQMIRQEFPVLKIELGGGYVNTELRSFTDPTIFRYVDYITYDDGELPLLQLLKGGKLVRTAFLHADGSIERVAMDSTENVPFAEIGTPDYSGLTHNKYIDLIELANPMHMLWSNGRWNKMMLAHGCYWAQCAFCDVSLDYIKRYEPIPARIIVDRMEALMKQTGQSGFHFVDEAASPAVLRKVAEEILRRKLVVTYWTNIRFEKGFNRELCGLEVASERILKLINKGITIQNAAMTMANLTDAGIMVHTYLMYGFPTETEQETIDSLEIVRQMFENGLMQSSFWHRYAMTCHSPSGSAPEEFGARLITPRPNTFANNEIFFTLKNTLDLDGWGKGLNLANYNFMRGAGFELPLYQWFEIKVPSTRIQKNRIAAWIK